MSTCHQPLTIINDPGKGTCKVSFDAWVLCMEHGRRILRDLGNGDDMDMDPYTRGTTVIAVD